MIFIHFIKTTENNFFTGKKEKSIFLELSQSLTLAYFFSESAKSSTREQANHP